MHNDIYILDCELQNKEKELLLAKKNRSDLDLTIDRLKIEILEKKFALDRLIRQGTYNSPDFKVGKINDNTILDRIEIKDINKNKDLLENNSRMEVNISKSNYRFSLDGKREEDVLRDYYRDHDFNEKYIKKYDAFMDKYNNNLLKADYKTLSICEIFQESLTKLYDWNAWENYEEKDNIALEESDSSQKYIAYSMPENDKFFFLLPNKTVKFKQSNSIINAFLAFFDFDIDIATGERATTPKVLVPAVVKLENGVFRIAEDDMKKPLKGVIALR